MILGLQLLDERTIRQRGAVEQNDFGVSVGSLRCRTRMRWWESARTDVDRRQRTQLG
jgi:hypothetical protein